MTSRKPIHKQLSSPESPKKPKVRKTKAVLKAAKNQPKNMVTGTVSALRADGTVNVSINGFRYQGVPTMADYTPRNIGDRVMVHRQGGQLMVLGKVGSDDFAAAPGIYITNWAIYSWGVAMGTNDKALNYGLEQVGRKSERFPVNDADYMARLAFSYYVSSSPNTMNGPADLTKNIDIYLERDEWDGGYDGPAGFTLFAIKNDALPADPSGLQYQTGLTTPSIDFTLEPGEMKIITLPDDWRNSIGATTLDANSIRGFVIEPQGQSIAPFDVSEYTYGLFTAMSGALRIYNQS